MCLLVLGVTYAFDASARLLLDGAEAIVSRQADQD